MTTKDDALKLALEALKQIDEAMPFPVAKLAIMEAEKALAQPEQEPDDLTIAYMSGVYDGKKQRTWVGLTDEEMPTLTAGLGPITLMPFKETKAFIRAIEAKLKEKNT